MSQGFSLLMERPRGLLLPARALRADLSAASGDSSRPCAAAPIRTSIPNGPNRSEHGIVTRLTFPVSRRRDGAADRVRARLQGGGARRAALSGGASGDRGDARADRPDHLARGRCAAPLRINVLPDGLPSTVAAPARSPTRRSPSSPPAAQPSDRRADASTPAATSTRGAPSCCCSGGRRKRSAPTAASRASGRPMAGRHVELREIDYAEVLRERAGGDAAAGTRSSRTACRAARSISTKTGSRSCSGIAGDASKLAELMASLESRRDGRDGIGAKTRAR